MRSAKRKFELIAGERRWRAVQRLGWAKIPAVVKEVDDKTLLTLALIENLQRDDLTSIDEAAGYRRLGEEFQIPQAEIARLVGRNRSTVANLLRLLKLPDEVKAMVQEGKLSEGHARALLAVEKQSELGRLAKDAVDQGWSVREVEARARGDAPAVVAPVPQPTARGPARSKDGHRRRETGGGRVQQAAGDRRAGHRPAAGPRASHHQLLLQRRSRASARADFRRTVRGMTRRSRCITVLIQRDGADEVADFRLSLWALRLGACSAGCVGCRPGYSWPCSTCRSVRAAARVPGLERELARLTRKTPGCASSPPRSTASRCPVRPASPDDGC